MEWASIKHKELPFVSDSGNFCFPDDFLTVLLPLLECGAIGGG